MYTRICKLSNTYSDFDQAEGHAHRYVLTEQLIIFINLAASFMKLALAKWT